jgi:hypothetical protein
MTIVVRDNVDSNGRREFSANVLSSDIPTSFITSRKQSIDIRILDMKDIDLNDKDTIYLPVALRGIGIRNNAMVYYYGSIPVQGDTGFVPQFEMTGFIRVAENGEKIILDQPFMRLEFRSEDVSSDDLSMPSMFGDRPLNLEPREHVGARENAMGGIDLRPGERKSDEAEQSREDKSELVTS